MISTVREKQYNIPVPYFQRSSVLFQTKKAVNKFVLVKNKKIFHFFADTNKLHGYFKLGRNGKNNTAFCCAVKFCNGECRNIGGCCKLFGLFQCILSC